MLSRRFVFLCVIGASKRCEPALSFSVDQLKAMLAIERVEVYFRTQLAYELARVTGAFGFLDAHNLPRLKQGKYDKFIARCKDEPRRSREPFALHSKETYSDEHEPSTGDSLQGRTG